MPISYALLLCIPIGFVFFLIARFLLRYLMSHYERSERRVALIFGLFGTLLIPTIWVGGCLDEEFPTFLRMGITQLMFLVEVGAVAEFVRRSYMRSRDEEHELKEREKP
jgi:hypothetical protein